MDIWTSFAWNWWACRQAAAVHQREIFEKIIAKKHLQCFDKLEPRELASDLNIRLPNWYEGGDADMLKSMMIWKA